MSKGKRGGREKIEGRRRAGVTVGEIDSTKDHIEGERASERVSERARARERERQREREKAGEI